MRTTVIVEEDLWPYGAARPRCHASGVVEHDRAGLKILSKAESLALLASVEIGRIGISSKSLPLVLPVRFALQAERIVLRTWDGSTLSTATDGAVVAFEADGLSGGTGLGWSVVVTGMANHIADDGLPAQLSAAPAELWLSGGPSHAISISTDLVSGRRIVPLPGRASP